jgi:hypothetical protein
MATDPSWLYSTIAQSSAAIVAIIGGFITATILRLTAEKESLVKQVSDRKKRLDSLKKHHLDVLTVNMEELEDDIPILEARIKAFSYPPNLGWGLFVLLLLAIFGIIIPVLVIFAQAFSVTNSLIVIISFILALATVFAYIYTQIRSLRRK